MKNYKKFCKFLLKETSNSNSIETTSLKSFGVKGSTKVTMKIDDSYGDYGDDSSNFGNWHDDRRLNEGLADYLSYLGLATALLLGTPNAEAAIKHNLISNVSSPVPAIIDPIQKYIADHEGYKPKAYLDTKGFITIGIGHLIQGNERQLFEKLFGSKVNYDKILIGEQELTDEQISKLFQYDMKRKQHTIQKLFPKYDSYNQYVKMAIADGVFRGDLSGSPKTIEFINNGKWNEAAIEYLNNSEYRKHHNTGTSKRMDDNARIFKMMGSGKLK